MLATLDADGAEAISSAAQVKGAGMGAMLEYKGYFGSVACSAEDGVLHGRLEFIRDLVTYEGKDVKGLKAAFQEALDDYLELYEAEGCKGDCQSLYKNQKHQ
ncbi:MAG: hypothetical protein ACK5PU_03395 [bacterium]